jgi:hypothetical protein
VGCPTLKSLKAIFTLVCGFTVLPFLLACSNPLGSNSAAQTPFLETAFLADQNGSAASGFGAGIFKGTAWDPTNSYVRLDQTGLATDLELDSSWTPAWSNLIGYWKLNEAAGSPTVADSSSSGSNIGTVNSGTTLGASGMLGSAASFNGSSGFVDIPKTAANNFSKTQAFSLSLWMYATSASAYQVLLGDAINANPFNGIWVQYGCASPAQVICFILTDSTLTAKYIYTNATVATNQWHHIAVTYDGSQSTAGMQIYIDGSYAAVTVSSNATFATDISNAYDWLIGSTNGAAGGNFSGSIDDVAMWNTKLSPAALASIYQHESTKHAGTFTSRVMDSFKDAPTWTSFSWTSTLPFMKELTDFFNGSVQSESGSSYSALTTNSLMNGLVGLYHFDEVSWNGTAAEVKDRSSLGNHGTAGSGANTVAGGKLNKAANFLGGQYVSLPATLNPWNGDFTLGVWMKTTTVVPWEQVAAWSRFRFGIEAHSGWTVWTGEDGGNIFLQGGAMAVPGQWAYVLFTYASATGTATLYVNGVSVANVTGGTLSGVNPGLVVGTGPGQTFYGSMDELGVWNRVLSPTEVARLYRRGANRTEYQVRTCSDFACGTNPNWLGPDGTSQTYFSELNNNVIPSDAGDLTLNDAVQAGVPLISFSQFGNLIIPKNRYLQYRAIMESDDSSTACNYGSGPTWCSPELQGTSSGVQ